MKERYEPRIPIPWVMTSNPRRVNFDLNTSSIVLQKNLEKSTGQCDPYV